MSVEKRITDVSEKYSIMCKKANEFIQPQIHPNKLVYAKLKDSDEEPTVHIVTPENINNFENPVRVFSQREIERLIYEPDMTCVQNFLDFAKWAKGLEDSHYLSLDSMEKIMLCYLMDKIYCKWWNGTAWVDK